VRTTKASHTWSVVRRMPNCHPPASIFGMASRAAQMDFSGWSDTFVESVDDDLARLGFL
jgi:hypothetical protein